MYLVRRLTPAEAARQRLLHGLHRFGASPLLSPSATLGFARSFHSDARRVASLFQRFDADGSGFIDSAEFAQGLRSGFVDAGRQPCGYAGEAALHLWMDPPAWRTSMQAVYADTSSSAPTSDHVLAAVAAVPAFVARYQHVAVPLDMSAAGTLGALGAYLADQFQGLCASQAHTFAVRPRASSTGYDGGAWSAGACAEELLNQVAQLAATACGNGAAPIAAHRGAETYFETFLRTAAEIRRAADTEEHHTVKSRDPYRAGQLQANDT
jgi:hypothetical protein